MERPSGPSVLLAFRASNFASYRDAFELSFVATSKAKSQSVFEVDRNAVGGKARVLPQAAIFGANASGKSNVLDAISFLRFLVVDSFAHRRPTDRILRRPFMLDATSRDRPSHFEIEFVFDGVHHHYGVSVDDERVHSEWLNYAPRGRTAKLFEREGDAVTLGKAMGPARESARDLLRPNALLLSTAAATNHAVLGPIYRWFARNLLIASPANSDQRTDFTAKNLRDGARRQVIIDMLSAADLGITGARVITHAADSDARVRAAAQLGIDDDERLDDLLPTEWLEPRLTHAGETDPEEFPFAWESQGTQTWFSILGPLLHILSFGGVLLLDEIDASLHPALVREAVRLIQSPEHNQKRAQMVFTTHDTTLLGNDLGPRLLGRDQVWFAERHHSSGASELFSLADIAANKDDSWARRYLAGRYGAMPVLSAHEFVPTPWTEAPEAANA